ncbi:MAG: penicillin-binding protein 1C [Verrucomicrobiota bacterium]
MKSGLSMIKGKTRRRRPWSFRRVIRRLWLLPLFLLAAWFALRLVPLPATLLKPSIQSIALTDRNGVPLRESRVEERFSRELTLDAVPPHVIRAILAAEDKRFHLHPGIDPLAMARAAVQGLRKGRIISGASTITQQLIKIAEPRPRSFRTKFFEGILALRIEQAWTKDQILSAYLNRLDFGNLNIGLASAAHYYFEKPVRDLSEAEAAFLAGLPLNPHRLNPHVSEAASRRRQGTVLRRMRKNHWLTLSEYDRARSEPLRLRPPRRLFRAPHFVDLVLRQAPQAGVSEIRTTLDASLNEEVERIVRNYLEPLRDKNVQDAAAVVIDNATGDVLALVGSGNYFAPGTGQVNGAWAPRSAGSTLKPFTYLLALERGATPATVVADVRTAFPTADGPYRPENYNRRCYGPVRYRTALASSLNIPAVKVLLAGGGPDALHERLQLCGLSTLTQPAETYGLGLTLGNCEARLLELTNAYAALARLGEYRPFRLLADRPTGDAIRVARPELVWQIADMMRDNGARTLAFGMHSALRYAYPVACKTGTSSDFRDNWTLGFTPEFTAGVWVGNFDGSPMSEVSGVTGAAPILHAIFDHLHTHAGTSWYATPPEVVERSIHPLTGKLISGSSPALPEAVREKFLPEQLPAQETPSDYDATGKVKLGIEFSEWLASAENSLTGRVVASMEDSSLEIITPPSGSLYLIDPDIPSSTQIPLAARGAARVQWKSETLECIEGKEPIAIAAEGEHQIMAVDPETGRSAVTVIRIRQL